MDNYGSSRSNRSGEGRPRSTYSVVMEETEFDAVENNPNASIHAVAFALAVSRCSIQRILNAEILYAYYFHGFSYRSTIIILHV
ncbi:hypothetical protein CDAR_425021 [Caerostris darwini]|uniref:Uncharacterized protein n=1 Tax=Caerostris darwini TaxID=1538125 RepID=A0AAV4S9Z4_9ARAC|nr:hypothetical protein CDAR_425021 [Caerostris darwini]